MKILGFSKSKPLKFFFKISILSCPKVLTVLILVLKSMYAHQKNLLMISFVLPWLIVLSIDTSLPHFYSWLITFELIIDWWYQKSNPHIQDTPPPFSPLFWASKGVLYAGFYGNLIEDIMSWIEVLTFAIPFWGAAMCHEAWKCWRHWSWSWILVSQTHSWICFSVLAMQGLDRGDWTTDSEHSFTLQQRQLSHKILGHLDCRSHPHL